MVSIQACKFICIYGLIDKQKLAVFESFDSFFYAKTVKTWTNKHRCLIKQRGTYLMSLFLTHSIDCFSESL